MVTDVPRASHKHLVTVRDICIYTMALLFLIQPRRSMQDKLGGYIVKDCPLCLLSGFLIISVSGKAGSAAVKSLPCLDHTDNNIELGR